MGGERLHDHREGRRVLAAALSGLLLLGVMAGIWAVMAPTHAARQAALTRDTAREIDQPVDPVTARRLGITTLLDERARAIVAGDRAGFLAGVSTHRPEFVRQQRTLFNRLGKVPFRSWEYEYAGDGTALTGEASSALPPGSYVARIVTRYRFAGAGGAVVDHQQLTFAREGDDWRLVGTREEDETDATGGRGLWDVGPIKVVRDRRYLVIGNARPELRRVTDAIEQGVEDVAEVVPWNRTRPVVLLPGSQADMASVVGLPPGQASSIGALAVGNDATGLSASGNLVVINPKAWFRFEPLHRRTLMAHELTHVRMHAVGDLDPPIWLVEGFADYVSYAAAGIDPRAAAGRLLQDVARGRVPAEFPDAFDFDPSKPRRFGLAYEEAATACQYVADTYGQRRLVRLYRIMASWGDIPTDQIKEATGLTQVGLERAWQGYLRRLAG